MNSETIVYCVVALILGMLLANMLKNVCGCKTVEGLTGTQECAQNYEAGKDCKGLMTDCNREYEIGSDCDASEGDCKDPDFCTSSSETCKGICTGGDWLSCDGTCVDSRDV